MKIKYDYLTLAFLPKFYPFEQDFSIIAGPQFGLLTRGLIKDKNNEIDVKSELKIPELSLAIGLGFKILSDVEFVARYNLGVSTTVKSPLVPGEKFPNRVIQFGISALF